jgi:hypothetical protein
MIIGFNKCIERQTVADIALLWKECMNGHFLTLKTIKSFGRLGASSINNHANCKNSGIWRAIKTQN